VADGERQSERVVLTFSPLPQDAWSEEREVAQDELVLDRLRRWGDHLARAIRISDRLVADGWRLRLGPDLVVAEKRAEREELESLARELKDDLRDLTATAELDAEDSYLSYRDDDVRRAAREFRPLIDD
jgi:hypothetical protein